MENHEEKPVPQSNTITVPCTEFKGACLGITTIKTHVYKNSKCKHCGIEATFSIDDVKLGKCMQCGVQQTQKGSEGLWICGLDNWACYSCKYGTGGKPAIRSRPFACEICQFGNVIWYQGGCYDCPRCDALFPKKKDS